MHLGVFNHACQAGAPNPTQPLEDVVSNIEAVPQPRIDVLVTAAACSYALDITAPASDL